MEKNCLICNKQFSTAKQEQTCCSLVCSKKQGGRTLHSTKGRRVRLCRNCGRSYVPKAADRITFCSRGCAYAHKTHLSQAHTAQKQETLESRRWRVCVICSKKFYNLTERAACDRNCELELRRIYARENYGECTEARRLTAQRMRLRFPEKARAREQLWHAVRKGLVSKPLECQRCGQVPPLRSNGYSGLEGHHHLGYANPLSVRWLCSACHGIEDVIEGHRRGRAPIISTSPQLMSEWAVERERPRNGEGGGG